MNSSFAYNPFTYAKKKIKSFIDRWKRFSKVVSHFTNHVKKQKKRLTLSLLAGIGYTFAGLLEPWPLKLLYDNVFFEEPLPNVLKPFLGGYADDKLTMLNILIVLIIVISLLRGVCYYFQQLLTSRSGQQIVTAIRLDLYSHLQRLSFSFHDKRRTGDMLARLTTDIRILREILISFPLSTTSELLLMISMLTVMAFMDFELTLISLLVVPLLMLLVKKYRSPMKDAMRQQREREGHLTSIASEVLGAIKVVQGFHQEGSEVAKFNVENKNSLKSGLRATRLEAKLKWASELCVAIVTALVFGYAGRKVLINEITPGDLLVFAFYLRNFNQPLRRISKKTELMARGTASGERILHLMEIKPEIRDKKSAKEAPRFQGKIEFCELFFEYKPNRPVLKNINLYIEAGQRIAIVGSTGSGKSTLASLLPRFYDPTSGEVRIDGTEIRSWKISSLRQQISIVFQEPVLFATTIAENIAYGKPDATLDEIMEASIKAQIHPIIEALPDGYNTVLGERGGTLSGGQRQCVAIARSIIKNSPIVILDEPTTGLDLLSAMLVMNALKELMKNKTVLMISHQKETIQDVDRIIQLKRGQIVKENRPEDFWIKETNLQPGHNQ